MSEIKLNSRHKIVPVSGEEDERQRRLFKGHQHGTIKLQPGGWYFNSFFPKFANSLYNFEYKSTDVLIMTHPRSGSTWTQELVWTMRNNVNFENPKQELSTNARVPLIEMDYLVEEDKFKELSKNMAKEGNLPESVIEEGLALYSVKNLPDPRTIKTHLPLSLLPSTLLSTSKVIYVARNPKAVCVSFHHLCRLFLPHEFVGSFDEFLDLFINDEVVFGPYFNHVLEAWNRRQHENLLFLFYENMKADPQKEYQRINDFLGTNLTADQISKIVAYTDFSQMKERNNYFAGKEIDSPIVKKNILNTDGGFFRKGQSNDWKSKLTKQQEEKLDKWIAERTKGTDLKFM